MLIGVISILYCFIGRLDLIDGIGSLEDALLLMRRDFGLWDCQFTDIAYEYEGAIGIFDLLYYLTGKATPQEARAQAQSQSETAFPINYLCSVMDQE